MSELFGEMSEVLISGDILESRLSDFQDAKSKVARLEPMEWLLLSQIR